MGQAIKLVNSNFINRNIGIVHMCKYDISYCTLYKYLIGDSNSWIDLGFKASQYNIKKVWGKAITEVSNNRLVIGCMRYVSGTNLNLTGVTFAGINDIQGINALVSWYDSSLTALNNIGNYKPHTNIEQCVEVYSKIGSGPTYSTLLKWYQNGELKVNISSTSNVATRDDDYNIMLMAGYYQDNFLPCDNGIYVSRIYFEDINNQDDPNNPNYDLPGIGMPLDLVPCQLNRDIDGSLAFDGKSHSAGECGFVNFFNGKFYGSTTATKGFSVSNF